jgi:hypothetical protein
MARPLQAIYDPPVNKADPNDFVSSFVDTTNDALADWRTIDGALASSGIRLRRKAASDAFMSLAVAWETFLSHWLIAAVNKDSSKTISALSSKLADYATSELRIPSRHVAATVITQSHFAVAEVRHLLDPNDFNVVLRDWQDLLAYGRKWLAEPYESAITSVTKFQYMPAIVTRLIRNALAHQSTAALTAANDVISKNTTPMTLRWNGQRLDVDGWRRYLLTATAPVPRIEIIHVELGSLAMKLTVT